MASFIVILNSRGRETYKNKVNLFGLSDHSSNTSNEFWKIRNVTHLTYDFHLMALHTLSVSHPLTYNKTVNSLGLIPISCSVK